MFLTILQNIRFLVWHHGLPFRGSQTEVIVTTFRYYFFELWIYPNSQLGWAKKSTCIRVMTFKMSHKIVRKIARIIQDCILLLTFQTKTVYYLYWMCYNKSWRPWIFHLFLCSRKHLFKRSRMHYYFLTSISLIAEDNVLMAHPTCLGLKMG